MKKLLLITFFCCTAVINSVQAQLISTFAGSYRGGVMNGTGTAAIFSRPTGVAVDGFGNMYVADKFNHLIRKITPAAVVSTFAGSGNFGTNDGSGAVASFAFPVGVAVDGSGNVYVADELNQLIRKITPTGIVSTLAARRYGSVSYAFALAVDDSGNMYVAYSDINIICKITPDGVMSDLAGSGNKGYANGTGIAASFNFPSGVAVDGSGNVYVADQGNNVIRKITSDGVVSTLAGSGVSGYVDGAGTTVSFSNPSGLAVDDLGNVYVADTWNSVIRKITPTGVVTTFAGSGNLVITDVETDAKNVGFFSPLGLALDGSGNLYVTDGKLLFPLKNWTS